MMRKVAALLLVLLAPTGGLANTPTETVTVDANDLVGVWKIGFPVVSQLSFFHGLRWGPIYDGFCRIEQKGAALSANCFPGPGIDGTVSVENKHFHMAWGTIMARAVVDGTMQSETRFTANFAVKLSGIAAQDADVSDGIKLNLSDAPPDKAGKSGLLKHLLEEMGKGAQSERFDPENSYVQIPKPQTLESLGAIESILYLGTTKKRKKEKPPFTYIDFFEVYDVEFTNGHRICGLHQRDDGVLDGFRCI